MEVTMNEKFAKGTKDFNILIQKAKASGADAFMPTAYEGDQMTIARQLRETNADFKACATSSTPRSRSSSPSARTRHYLFSQTLLNDKINWKVTSGLNRAQDDGALRQALPQRPVSPPTSRPRWPTARARWWSRSSQRPSRSTPPSSRTRRSSSATRSLRSPAPYQIDETGKQFKNEFAVMQNMPERAGGGLSAEIATAKAVYPVPPFEGPEVVPSRFSLYRRTGN